MLNIISTIINAAIILIIAAAFLSWFPAAKYHPLGRLVLAITEPMLAPFRKLVKPIHVGRGHMLDLSPLVCIVALNVLDYVLRQVLR